MKQRIKNLIERVLYTPMYHIMKDVLDEIKVSSIIQNENNEIIAYLFRNYIPSIGDKIDIVEKKEIYVVKERIITTDNRIIIKCKLIE